MVIGRWFLVCLLFTVNFQSLWSQSSEGDPALAKQLVGTLVGSRAWSGAGDEALDAGIISPSDFAFTPSGEMLIASSSLHQVFRIGSDGVVRVFAGTGIQGHSEDGVNKEDANFDRPRSLAIGADGTVYIAQQTRVQKISPQGFVSTVIGNGDATACLEAGSSPSRRPASDLSGMNVGLDGSLFVISCGSVFKLDGNTVTQLLQRGGTKTDALAIAATEVPATSWRSGRADFIATLPNGDLLIADVPLREIYALTSRGMVRRIAGARARSLTFPESGMALDFYLGHIGALAVQSSGAIYVVPWTSDRRVAVIEPDGSFRHLSRGHMEFLVEGIPSPDHSRTSISSLRIGPDDSLYASLITWPIFRLAADGKFRHVAIHHPTLTDETTPEADLARSPMQLLAGPETGEMFAVITRGEDSTERIYHISPDGVVTHFAGTGESRAVEFGRAATETVVRARLAHGGAPGELYYRGHSDGVINRIGADGTIQNVLGGGAERVDLDLQGKRATELRLWGEPADLNPLQFLVSASGEIYFQRRFPVTIIPRLHRIWKVKQDGLITGVVGGYSLPPTDIEGSRALDIQLTSAAQMFLDPEGSFYFSYQAASGAPIQIYRIDEQGKLRLFAGNGQAGPLEVGRLPTETSLSMCSSLGFVAPRVLRCGTTGRTAYHFAEGVPVKLVLQNGSTYANDGGFLGDDYSASYLASSNWFRDGTVFGLFSVPGAYRVRRTWHVPQGCTYDVNADTFSVSATGGETSIQLTTASGCPWTAGTSKYWLSMIGRLFGTGATTFSLRFKRNPSTEPREGVVSIAGRRVVVTQHGTDAPPLFVSPLAQTISAEGGEGTISITAADGEVWQATVSQPWLSLVSTSAGSGSASVKVRAGANDSSSLRIAKVTVNGKELTIRQAALPAEVGDLPLLSAVLDAAGFRNMPLAADSIASLFGERLTLATAAAETIPLPTVLQGTSLHVRAGNYERAVPLFYASPNQINFLVPADAPEGLTTLHLVRDGKTVGSMSLHIVTVSPGVFSANSDGKGVPAGYTTRRTTDGIQINQNLFSCQAASPCEPVVLEYGDPFEDVYLVLFGSGFRGNSNRAEVTIGGITAEVTYAGPQGYFEGLDQINIRIPSRVRGLGLLNVELRHGGISANTVQVRF